MTGTGSFAPHHSPTNTADFDHSFVADNKDITNRTTGFHCIADPRIQTHNNAIIHLDVALSNTIVLIQKDDLTMLE